MPDPVIQVDSLSKRYRIGVADKRGGVRGALAAPFRYLMSALREPTEAETLWALKDVSFEVGRGEVLGVIGANGAGKSTLLKILSRITEPSEGRAVLHGRVGSLLEVGTGFHAELTGRENIFLSGAILGMKKAEIAGKFDEIVAFAEVEKFIDTPVKRYSSGMYVRLGFAVAAHLEPEILLVDEVLAVGDAAFQKKCLGRMGDVAREGRTVLFVSHNMNAVRSMCSRTVWLDGGHLRATGPSEVIISEYLDTVASGAPDIVWKDPDTAPGNEKVRLSSARIHAKGADPSTPIRVSDEFEVDIEYYSMVDGEPLFPSLSIYTAEGALVLIADSSLQNAQPPPAERDALYRTTYTFPRNLLNDGSYRIRLHMIGEGRRLVFWQDDVLRLDVQDDRDKNCPWFGPWPGIVRPVIAARHERLQTQRPSL